MTKIKITKLFSMLVGIGIIIALFLSFFLLLEFVRVGIIADPEVIKKYPFGECCGWTYNSPLNYSVRALAEGFYLLIVAAIFGLSILKKSKGSLYAGYLGLIIFFLQLLVL